MRTSAPVDRFALADWRRAVAESYARVRAESHSDAAAARAGLVRDRNQMFAHHPATPLNESDRSDFQGLQYLPYRPEWRLSGRLDTTVSQDLTTIDLGSDGVITLARSGRVGFTGPAGEAGLDVYWIAGYGGGLFLPFGDSSNGGLTYGGGRYLYDTIKGADLGRFGSDLILDFNFAYHPSCAYDSRWICPLAPPRNRLPFPVPAGEILNSPTPEAS